MTSTSCALIRWRCCRSPERRSGAPKPAEPAISRPDFTSTRLFVDAALADGDDLAVTSAQANYLLNVLRMGAGAGLLVFNGRDGEFRATIAEASRKSCRLAIAERTRAQAPAPDVHLLFAPLKHARLDYMVQKAVEMGAGVLRPVITRRTQVSRLNLERMQANVVEACEQCGVIAVPELRPPERLDAVLAGWPVGEAGRRLLFADEAADTASPLEALERLGRGPVAVLIGPEGGFAPEERAGLLRLPATTAVSLGPRILRADTAAVAALAVVQAAVGDWR